MSFLTPAAIWIAAALAVPPLVLLYFLKLKRQEMLISSTFFWKRAVQDLQVNAPFQRLRKNLLLLLQLLVLLLCVVALGQPLLKRDEEHRRSLILLIDRSASMNVEEADGRTRLERARDAALEMIEQMDQVDRVMIIAFNDRAEIVAPFSNNPTTLKQALLGVQPSEGLSRLSEAISLAAAHARTRIVEREGLPGIPAPTGPPTRLVLLSDGRIEDLERVSLERLAMDVVNVADNSDNVGILSLQASRHYEHPEQINVVASIANYGTQQVTTDVELFIAGEHHGIRTVQLGPGVAPAGVEDFDASASSAIVSFGGSDDSILEFSGTGVIEVQISRGDALAADNRAVTVIPPPRTINALLVNAGGLSFLSHALSVQTARVVTMTPQQYEEAPEEQLTAGGRSRYDVVVFESCSSARLPTGNYFFWGTVPRIDGFEQGEEIKYDTVYDWQDSHVVMRHIDPSNVDMFGYRKLILPDNAEPLMDAVQGGVVLAAVNHRGSRYLINAFSATNWFFKESLAIFMANALQYLAGTLDVDLAATTRPGDALVIAAPKSEKRVQVRRPDGTVEDVRVGSLDTAHYAHTDLVGIYEVSPTAEGTTRYPVNLFSPNESHIQPNTQFVIGGDALQVTAGVQSVNVPFWPWLLMAALAFLTLEWVVYSRRILV